MNSWESNESSWSVNQAHKYTDFDSRIVFMTYSCVHIRILKSKTRRLRVEAGRGLNQDPESRCRPIQDPIIFQANPVLF